jgi:hypothetical protein
VLLLTVAVQTTYAGLAKIFQRVFRRHVRKTEKVSRTIATGLACGLFLFVGTSELFALCSLWYRRYYAAWFIFLTLVLLILVNILGLTANFWDQSDPALSNRDSSDPDITEMP